MGVNELGGYAENLIRSKARRLVGVAGLTASDVPDLQQEMRFDLLKRLAKHDVQRAPRNAFITRLVNNHIATIIEARNAKARDYHRHCSLNGQVADTENVDAEPADLLDAQADGRFHCAEHSHESHVALALDLAKAVADLPPDLQDLCRRLMQQSPTEISKETGVPRGTLYEQRERLRRHFTERGLEEYL